METWQLKPHFADQQRILFWGTLVGYCGVGPHQPVCFLAGPMDRLSIREIGPVRITPQTREAFNELNSRADIESG
jgi:hypothetical protein